MREEARSTNEAMEWFLENHSGGVMCVSGSNEKRCYSFQEAKEFFNQI
jgi:hypothetical protein